MNLVSIIICVYNKEQYLYKCLLSVVNQTYNKLEIIVIDDGSTDNSLNVINKFAQLDSRIIVYSQENKGIGFSRHKGINLANGSYKIHIDPDDYVELDFIESLVNCAQLHNSDITICDFDVRDKSNQLINQSNQKPTELNSDIIMMDIVRGKLHGSLCNKLIKKDLYEQKISIWPVNLSFCEDQIIVLQLLKNNTSVSYLNKSLYHYIQYDESLSNLNPKKILENFIKYLIYLKKICGKEYKYIYHTSALYSKYYLINSNSIRRFKLHFYQYKSMFFVNKIGLSNYQKKVIYDYLSFPERIFFKLINKIL